MIRDPLYRDIIAGLSGQLDPDAFERCAVALLQTIHGGLVPVPGGSDGGMDGALADCEGEAYPLICTTGEDVLGNMTQSLRSYLQWGRPRRQVIVATSQELTAMRRRNLETRASELGFTLVQTYSRAAFANLLYRDPAWCLELLNLSGNPPALSALPITNRPTLTSALIGRQEDLAWLRAARGDVLLVGQPGSGKTFLLSALIDPDDGLFVNTDDLCQIAAGLRAQQPKLLLVDDAHLRRDLLARLRQHRQETGYEFRIVADCWPGERDAVMAALCLGPSAVRTLDLLTRAEMVEVIQACGIEGPNRLLHELVHQADGRPGLAVTLCYLCLQEGIREVALGNALSRDIRETFGRLVGEEAALILTAFALGGECGMGTEAVGRQLGMAPVRVLTVVTRLAAGGVLNEIHQDVLAVRPEALRHALVRDVFLAGPARPLVERFLAEAPNRESAVRTLIGARGRGGEMSFHRLTSLLDPAWSDDTWLRFAANGPEESRWVLEQHPERLLAVAEAGLHFVPCEVIPLLLDTAGDDGDAQTERPRPLQIIDDWARGAFPATEEFVGRREELLHDTLAWLDGGGSLAVALRAVQSALSPDFAAWESSPGDRNSFTRTFGFGTPEELEAIHRLWPRVLPYLQGVRVQDWAPLEKVVQSWAHPAGLGVAIGQDLARSMVAFAGQVLQHLAQVGRNSPGFLRWATRQAGLLGVALDIQMDPEFLTLYPVEELPQEWARDWPRVQREEAAAACELGARWAEGEPRNVAHRLMQFEEEAGVGRQRVWPRWSPLVCHEIARRITCPGAWLEALCEANASGDLVEPFLRRVVELEESGWADRLADGLGRPSLRGAALSIILQLPNPPPGLLNDAMGCLGGLDVLVSSLCYQGMIPEECVLALLRHEDRGVAGSVATALWHAPPVGEVSPRLRAEWREAVVRCLEDCPGAILRSAPDLARDWLAARIRSRSLSLWHRGTAHEALGMLTVSQRADLLREAPEEYWGAEVVQMLVGDDLEVYGLLLKEGRLRRHHLVPLRGRPVGGWAAKAVLALDAGYSCEEVAWAAHGGVHSWSGSQSAMWEEWRRSYERLEADADPRVRRVGRIGREGAEARREGALREERHEAIHGYGG